jgi:hypothetical protein
VDEKVSLREFARRLGVSDTAVRKAIEAGKISTGCLDYSNANRPKINANQARTEWGKNYVSAYTQSETLEIALSGSGPSGGPASDKTPRASPRKKTVKKVPSPPQQSESDAHHAAAVEQEAATVDSDTIVLSKSADTKEAKRVEAIAKAKLAMVELKEKKGKLIDKAAAYKEFFAAGQAVRAAFQGIPDKWIDNILACSTRSEAHALLTEAIIEALETLSKPPHLNS